MARDGGIGRLKKRLAAIPVAVREQAYKDTLAAAEDIANRMRMLVPVDKGDLKESITVTPGGQSTPPHSQPGGANVVPDNKVAITAGNNAVRYPHLVEYGSPFIDMDEWDACGADFDIEELKGSPVWLGVDCSTVRDLSVVTACFREGGKYMIHSHFFCPSDNLAEKSGKDGVPYEHWAEAGYITPTPGGYVDHVYIERYIREFCERFPTVKEIAFDQTYAGLMIGSLRKSSHPVITMKQGWFTQSPALNRLETSIIARKLQHDRNPILRWNFENAEVHTDSNGNRTLEKSLTTKRIDGCFSTWMAHDRASFGEDARNIYASGQRRGFASVKF